MEQAMACGDKEFTLVDGIQLDAEPNGDAMVYRARSMPPAEAPCAHFA